MAILLKEEKNQCIFALWAIEETEEELFRLFLSSAPQKEIDALNNFKNPVRRIERMASRQLIYELLGKKPPIGYDEFGKPFIHGDKRSISISHTKGMLAVQIGNYNAGIDIEYISDRVAKVAHKFLSAPELDTIDIKQQMLHMYAFWCAKETVYKIYGKKRLDFKKHIHIEPFSIEQEGVIKASLNKADKQDFLLDYFIYELNEQDKYMIVKYCQ
ncbi:MAG: 4'-phosphopantetheinyl transferase superfamily protein [Bacteroidales bacterium]|nr:4'-phosphopantetheinyl transferase superfamily protein [Bacteroidales bacterium]